MNPLLQRCGSRANEAQTSGEPGPSRAGGQHAATVTTELLILPDGRILVHNLTLAFAGLLAGLNPDCEQITSRLARPPVLGESPAPPG